MSNAHSPKPLQHSRKNRFRSRGLAVAATAVTAGLADSATAAIISDLTSTYSPPDSLFLNGLAEGEIELHIGMGGDDVSLKIPGGMNPVSTVEFSIFSADADGMPADFLTLLNPGDTVDVGLTFESQGALSKKAVKNPDWDPGVTGYAGFTFDPGTGSVFGWLEVEFDISGADFTVLGWAYDDTGAPIDIPVLLAPEPSTALLVGLGLAGLAAGLRRRRRSGVSRSG